VSGVNKFTRILFYSRNDNQYFLGELKMKKALVLSLALAATTGANAAWVNGSGGTDGELVLTVWNTSTNKSFTQDLGVLTSAAINGSLGEQTFALDAAGLAHVFGDESDIVWNVAGANTTALNSIEAIESYGIYYTGSAVANNPSQVQIATQAGFFQQYANDLGAADSGTAANPVFLLEGVQYAGTTWGGSMGGILGLFGVPNSELVNGQSSGAGIAGLFFTGSGWDADSRLDGTGNQWTLDLAGGLVYGSSAPEIPVPAAAWLFGSALIGLAGVGRKRLV